MNDEKRIKASICPDIAKDILSIATEGPELITAIARVEINCGEVMQLDKEVFVRPAKKRKWWNVFKKRWNRKHCYVGIAMQDSVPDPLDPECHIVKYSPYIGVAMAEIKPREASVMSEIEGGNIDIPPGGFMIEISKKRKKDGLMHIRARVMTPDDFDRKNWRGWLSRTLEVITKAFLEMEDGA